MIIAQERLNELSQLIDNLIACSDKGTARLAKEDLEEIKSRMALDAEYRKARLSNSTKADLVNKILKLSKDSVVCGDSAADVNVKLERIHVLAEELQERLL